jgi:hypothetical protein
MVSHRNTRRVERSNFSPQYQQAVVVDFCHRSPAVDRGMVVVVGSEHRYLDIDRVELADDEQDSLVEHYYQHKKCWSYHIRAVPNCSIGTHHHHDGIVDVVVVYYSQEEGGADSVGLSKCYSISEELGVALVAAFVVPRYHRRVVLRESWLLAESIAYPHRGVPYVPVGVHRTTVLGSHLFHYFS